METVYATSLVPDSSWLIEQGQTKPWSKEDNKRFESALAIYDERTPNRWFKVAEMIPGKSVCDVMNQYRELVADVSDIEAGLVPIPGYLASSFTFELADHRGFDVYRKRGRNCDQERKKGVPWTEDEHRRFLLGLQKHGKGDWRSISRNFVVTKTPTQVASHAQKYYLRQLSGGKDKRRPSIHDITTVNTTPAQPNIASVHSPPSTGSKIVMEWNNHKNNDASLMVFDGNSFVAYPNTDIPKHAHYIFNIGASSPGRFYV